MLKEMKKTGQIKWVSRKNNYGFITDSDNVDYFFYLNEDNKDVDIKDVVEFEAIKHPKGTRGKHLKILEKHSIEKVKCKNCEELMVPKLIIQEKHNIMGTVEKLSVCPYCDHEIMKLEESEIENSKLLSQLLFLTFMLMLSGVFIFEFII